MFVCSGILLDISSMFIIFFILSIFMLVGFIFGIMVMMVTVVAYILGISFTLWMLVHAAKQDKFWWIVLIVGLPFVGAVVYYFVEKEHDYAKLPKQKASSKKQAGEEDYEKPDTSTHLAHKEDKDESK